MDWDLVSYQQWLAAAGPSITGLRELIADDPDLRKIIQRWPATPIDVRRQLSMAITLGSGPED